HREAQRTQNSQDVGGSFQPFEWQLVVPRSQIDPSSEVPAIAPYSNTSGWQDGSQQNWQEETAAGFFGYAPPPPQIDPSSDGWQQNWHFAPPLTPEFGLTQNELPPPTPQERPWDDSNVPANIPDFGSVVGRWQHGRQPAPDDLSRALIEHGLMPAWNSQTSFLIHQELYTAELQWDGGVFLTHQSGAWLRDRDWLYDRHIERDFNLLRGELQRNHPDLAARTTLVDPAVVQLLQTDQLRAFQYMVRGQPGTAQEGAEDAADFVFIPVTDAQGGDPNQRGTHWSLLLLDRRDRNSPIAYHYDSAGDYNAAAAERVARGVGARVIRMGMAQQQNNHDCGVLLLEAARALIGQLTRSRPPRDLYDLVPDRRALQAR
ncbi:hypothetical protein BS630_23960, partial [Rhizobium laguerreae]